MAKRALLIIDMQKGSFTPQTPRYDAEGVIARINLLAEHFRKCKEPVIFIQHDGSAHNEFIPGTEAWEILSGLKVEQSDLVIPKTLNDAFYHSVLDETLRKLDVEEIVITGCATDFCVDSTIHSCLTNGYKTTVISDGHTTADREHLNAEQVIAHYNWVWQNLIPIQNPIRLIRTEVFLQSESSI